MNALVLCMTMAAWATVGIAPSAHADDAAARAAVESLLDRVEVAVLAADQAAYLSCVSGADPVWRHEQIAWAKDLSRHVPTQFEIVIDDQPGDEGDDAAPVADAAPPPEGEFHARLKMTWTMPEAKAPRTLRFAGRFVREGDSWLYGGEVWNSIVQPADAARGFHGAVVRYADGLEPQAKRLAETMARTRTRVDRLFGIVVNKPQEVKLYTSMRHLQASIYLSYTDGLGGWNEPGESIKILSSRQMGGGSGGGGGGVSAVVAHEYGHVVTFEFGPAITDAPWWVLEGIAEVAASAAAGRTDRRDAGLLAAVERGGLARFEDLSDFRNTQAKWRGLVYSQGQSMMDFIGRAFGHEARNQFLRVLATQATIDQASHSALGVGFADLDALWRFWITQRAVFRKADLAAAAPASAATPTAAEADPLGLASPDAP